MAMEQLSFDFKEEEKKVSEKPEGGYNFAEKDECSRCGHPFESTGSCVECVGNKIKMAYLKNLPKQKHQ